MTTVDSVEARLACPLVPWAGSAWRFHGRRYESLDPGGALRVTGRYHRGADLFPPEDRWPALYLALSPHIALGERLRHVTPETLAKLRSHRLTQVAVRLAAVLDCRDLNALGIDLDELCSASFDVSHALALAARDRHAEGLLVPSCTRFSGGVLVLFPDLVRATSNLTIVQEEDPVLGAG